MYGYSEGYIYTLLMAISEMEKNADLRPSLTTISVIYTVICAR